ncbi:MAG: DUF4381 domain-containing protein [Parahaliea sp.]
MNQAGTDPLAQLAPLRLPAEVSWWPPAPGWWILAFIVLILIVGIARQAWRRYQQQYYLRQALTQLEQLRTGSADASSFAAACNRLLKAVAIRSYPSARVASLSGDAWLAFLNNSISKQRSTLFDNNYTGQLYRPGNDIDEEALYQACRQWIKRHRRHR